MIFSKVLINQRERTRFVRFLVVGTIGAVVDFSTFNLLVSLLNLNAVLASVISFCTAILSNFLWNRFWTYPDSRSKNMLRQISEFTIVSIIGLGIRTPLFAWLEGPLQKLFSNLQFLPLSFISSEFLGHNTALAIAVIVVLFWNFFVNRYWTYNDVN
ncbi:MAG: GtrA family protein [Anaerolineales bacterium]|jgi:putative flippase GtrA